MNRINLLRETEKKGPGRSLPRISTKVLIIICAVILLPIGVIGIFKILPEKKVVQQVATDTTKSSYRPSTYSDKSSIVEDVVREISSERATGSRQGKIDIPYNDLSFLEKVNYEVLFAKNVFSLFSSAVPAGIGLKSLDVDNFQTLYAVGIGDTRDIISSTFIALKTEKVELLPKPFSYITSNDGDGYRFVVTCKINNGLDLSDPFQASDYLPHRDDLPIITKKIQTLGEMDSVLLGPPKQIKSEKVGVYGRFHYQYRGTTTYNNFVKFLLHLHEQKVPCAFKKVNLKAKRGAAVTIETTVIFTVRK